MKTFLLRELFDEKPKVFCFT